MKKLLLAAGVLFALSLFKKARAVYNFQLSIVDLSIGGTFRNPQLFIKIGIRNNENAAIRFNSLQGRVMLQNIYVGDIRYTGSDMLISANSTSYAEIVLTNLQPTIISNLSTLIRRPVKFAFDGFIGFEGVTIPLNFTYTW